MAFTGTSAVVHYAQTERLQWVALAGFLATACSLIKTKPFAIGLVTFLAGCYPLLAYKWKTGGNSLKENGLLDYGPVWRNAWNLWLGLGNINPFGAGTERALPPVGDRFDFPFPLLPWLFAAAVLRAP